MGAYNLTRTRCHKENVMKDISPVTVNPIVNRKKQKGQTMAEYAIIIALIALVCILAITRLGKSASGVFDKAADTLEDAGDD